MEGLISQHEGIFTLQWHITNRCLNNCLHCYIDHGDRNQNELQINEVKLIVDKIVSCFNRFNIFRSITLTGGDPLLYPHLKELIVYLRKKDSGLEINLLGTPDLLDKKWIYFFEEQQITYYQLSIDGLEDTHDSFRGNRSFDKTINTLKILSKTEIKPIVLSTVSPLNYLEMQDVAQIAIDYGAHYWDFARFIPTRENLKVDMFTPAEYRSFLGKMMNFYIKKNYADICVGRKDPLWCLVDTSKPNMHTDTCIEGCAIGRAMFTLLPNGQVMACRRHKGSIIGDINNQSFEDIFFNSIRLNQLRQFDKIEKCRDCDLLHQCRGCRAVAYSTSGEIFSPDPQCWKNI